MAIILGGVTLNPSMVWTDRYSWSPALQEVRITLGGSPIVSTASVVAGRPITLTALEDQGWLTTAMANAIQAMANVPGQIMVLIIGSENFSVTFRHHEPPALALQPLLPRAVPVATDQFIGEIKLMTV